MDPAAKQEKRVLDHIPQPVLVVLTCQGTPRRKTPPELPSHAGLSKQVPTFQASNRLQSTLKVLLGCKMALPRRKRRIQITKTKAQLGSGKRHKRNAVKASQVNCWHKGSPLSKRSPPPSSAHVPSKPRASGRQLSRTLQLLAEAVESQAKAPSQRSAPQTLSLDRYVRTQEK